MTIKGRVQRGVVVLQNGVTLPEGTEVTVSCERGQVAKHKLGKRVEFPLVRSKRPGTLQLSSERIATPREALSSGADYIVVGRAVTDSTDPRSAMQRLLDTL